MPTGVGREISETTGSGFVPFKKTERETAEVSEVSSR